MFPVHLVNPAMGLAVNEAGLKGQVDQTNISQGMFRALSLIIQMNSAIMRKNLSCVLIDDIGEGLDFDRSTKLIRLLIDKAEDESVQMIMSTNDRFVMNNVPLEYWTIVHRIGNKVRCINIRNKPELFEEFELTGLNNFDFFSSNFLLSDQEGNA